MKLIFNNIIYKSDTPLNHNSIYRHLSIFGAFILFVFSSKKKNTLKRKAKGDKGH